ncbi:hypothetical protein [Desulfosarcina sp.]|uniref:hypothetical protein n=1 Tax=Desulfosarcina sp. TaxID=2027861 RepID=UPI00397060C5
MHLVAGIKHIPVVAAGGIPDVKNLLVTFEGTHCATSRVACIGALAGSSDHHLQRWDMTTQTRRH